MTTATPADATSDYATAFRRELAVLPRRSAREILRDVEEHVAFGDGFQVAESLGAPSAVARSALDDQATRRGRPIRPSLSLPSKSLQLAVAVIAVPFILFALLTFPGVGSVDHVIGAVVWVLIALPPLLVRWPAWWSTSVACVSVHVAFVVVALIVSSAGRNVTAAGTAFLLTPPIAFAHVAALVLALVALLRAPDVLREGRR